MAEKSDRQSFLLTTARETTIFVLFLLNITFGKVSNCLKSNSLALSFPNVILKRLR